MAIQPASTALVDGILSQRRSDGLLFDDLDRRGKGAGAQHDGEIVRFLDAEIAGDFGAAAGNLLDDARRGINRAVEHDGKEFIDIGGGNRGEPPCAFGVHFEIDLGPSGPHPALVDGAARVLDGIAAHFRRSLHIIENPVHGAFGPHRIVAPQEFIAAQPGPVERFADIGALHDRVHLRDILHPDGDLVADGR